jgi:hypothetical protein
MDLRLFNDKPIISLKIIPFLTDQPMKTFAALALFVATALSPLLAAAGPRETFTKTFEVNKFDRLNIGSAFTINVPGPTASA